MLQQRFVTMHVDLAVQLWAFVEECSGRISYISGLDYASLVPLCSKGASLWTIFLMQCVATILSTVQSIGKV